MTRKYNPDLHHRHSLRLREYDYSQAGAYFVTVCTHKRECLFGEVVDGAMELNGYGQVVMECWGWLPVQYSHMDLDEWVVMPNHFHGILVIADACRGGSRTAPTTREYIVNNPARWTDDENNPGRLI